jgi:Flp pilus assembly pilin Flp
MDRMVTAYVCGRKHVRDIVSHGARGQTMTEYALILAAIAIAAYLTYQVMGQDISSMVTGIDTGLSSP